jgi:hypothetical protein
VDEERLLDFLKSLGKLINPTILCSGRNWHSHVVVS